MNEYLSCVARHTYRCLLPDLRKFTAVLCGLTALVGRTVPALAAEPSGHTRSAAEPWKHALQLDGSVNLADPRWLARIREASPDHVVVPVFWNGETSFSSPNLPFPQRRYDPAVSGDSKTGDPIVPLIHQVHGQSGRVYGFIDLLHWRHSGDVTSNNVLRQHPEWAERNLTGGCGSPADGAYASYLHPEVQMLAQKLVTEVVRSYPEMDGIVLLCRYPFGSVLGYSDTARLKYIDASQLDPIDLKFANASSEQLARSTDWINWRIDQMTVFVKGVADAYRRARPEGNVLTIGYANLYRLPLGSRNTLLEDWLRWGKDGIADGVILEAQWEIPANADALVTAESLIAQAAPAVGRVALVAPIDTKEAGGAPGGISKPWNLPAQRPEQAGLVYRISTVDNIVSAVSTWSSISGNK